MREIPNALRVVGVFLALYILVWFTDSIWEYVPESKPSTTIPTVVSPTPSPTPQCQSYENASGDFESSCEPLDEEDPGWQGR